MQYGAGALLVAWMWGGALPASSSFAGNAAAVPKGLQQFYDRKEYQKVLEELAKLDQETAAAPDIRRLKVRSLLGVGNPKEALGEYDKFSEVLKRDDPALLREVAIGFIVVLMKDMREQMRGAAYSALKEIGAREALPYLEDGLTDGSGVVRALVVEGLSLTEEGRRSPKLVKALDDQAGMVKAAALKALGRTKNPGVRPLLEQGLKDEQGAVQLAAAAGLVSLGHTKYWDQIRRTAGAMNPEERASALRLLGELKDPRAFPVLVEALKHPQPSVRGAAAAALGDLGMSGAVRELETLLKDKIPAVRTSAAVSLGELGDKSAVPALKEAMEEGNPVVQAAAVSALLRLNEPFRSVASVVRHLVQQQDPGSRSAAGRALGRAEGNNVEAAVGFLEVLLQDPIPRPRIAAARSLGHIGGENVLPLLKQKLHDEDDAVRATAAGALVHILNKRGSGK